MYNKMVLNKVKNIEDINTLAKLADIVWHEFFPCILTSEQIDYMVSKFQSFDALKEQVENGYEYYIVNDGENIGYIGFKKEPTKLFISKIYLLAGGRGKGYTKKIFKFLSEVVKNNNLDGMYLTVNKYNSHAIDVYKHYGFEIIDAVVTDIGNGFVMDDYIMYNKSASN